MWPIPMAKSLEHVWDLGGLAGPLGPTRGTDVVLVAGGYVVGQFLWWATWNVLGNW